MVCQIKFMNGWDKGNVFAHSVTMTVSWKCMPTPPYCLLEKLRTAAIHGEWLSGTVRARYLSYSPKVGVGSVLLPCPRLIKLVLWRLWVPKLRI